MSDVPITDPGSFRTRIAAFVQERLEAKAARPPTSAAVARPAEASQPQPETWVADAAQRVSRLQFATHIPKGVHPGIKDATSLKLELQALGALPWLGSQALPPDYALDVAGDAAALDVLKFLNLKVQDRTLLQALQEGDADALAALSPDPQQAAHLRERFLSILQPRDKQASTHPLAKQLYWLTGEDACNDADYELLVPLYPTSLVHAVHGQIQQDRFGEAQKAAREARSKGQSHPEPVREYRALAALKLGGTKPQNVSQLNSERGGVNYLLSSAPPQWRAVRPWLPQDMTSVFQRVYPHRQEVRNTLGALRDFLQGNPSPVLDSRLKRQQMVDTLIDEVVAMANEIAQGMPPGWTRTPTEPNAPSYDGLARAEMLWLDPLRADLPGEEVFRQDWMLMDWPKQVAVRFANWLNTALAFKAPELAMGEAEAGVWARDVTHDMAGFREYLRQMRDALRAPHYVPPHDTHEELVAQGRARQ